MAHNVWDGTKNTAASLAEGTKQAASNVAEGTKNAASTVAEGTRNVATSAYDGTKHAVDNVAEGTKNIAAAGVEKTGQAWEGINCRRHRRIFNFVQYFHYLQQISANHSSNMLSFIVNFSNPSVHSFAFNLKISVQ